MTEHEPTPGADRADTANYDDEAIDLMPTSQPVLLRAVRWGIVVSLLLVVVFAGIGWLVSGLTGVAGGAIGAGIAGLFITLTAGSIAFANRFSSSPIFIQIFFSIVMGAWLLKIVVFLVAALLLREQPWLNPTMMFIGIIVGVVVSLTVNAVVFARGRIPIANLPG
ncbi:3-oxoacyl-ACP reductase [Leucobacter sp. HY1908]